MYIAIILVLILLPLILFLVARQQAQKHQTSITEELGGICYAAFHQTVRKNKNKSAIMELFSDSQTLSNTDIRQTLGFPRRSVVRYLDELEKEGRVEQMTASGRGVVYRQKSA